MAHMKLEKISPNGRSLVEPVAVRAVCKAADQKNMKRYIVPSKTHEISPSDKILGLPVIARMPDLKLSDGVWPNFKDPKFSRCELYEQRQP